MLNKVILSSVLTFISNFYQWIRRGNWHPQGCQVPWQDVIFPREYYSGGGGGGVTTSPGCKIPYDTSLVPRPTSGPGGDFQGKPPR